MITRRDVLIALGRGDLDGVPIAHKDLFETNTHELGGGVTTIHPFFGTSRFEAPVPTGLERAAANRALRDDQRSVRERFADLDLILTPTVPGTAPLIDGPIAGGVLLRTPGRSTRRARQLSPSLRGRRERVAGGPPAGSRTRRRWPAATGRR